MSTCIMSLRMDLVVSSTTTLKMKVQMGSAMYQRGSSWLYQISAPAMATPMLCRMSPITCSTALRRLMLPASPWECPWSWLWLCPWLLAGLPLGLRAAPAGAAGGGSSQRTSISWLPVREMVQRQDTAWPDTPHAAPPDTAVAGRSMMMHSCLPDGRTPPPAAVLPAPASVGSDAVQAAADAGAAAAAAAAACCSASRGALLWTSPLLLLLLLLLLAWL